MLGKWQEYPAIREGILRLNDQHGNLLSNDLGAIVGLLFDVGSGRFKAPARVDEADGLAAWEAGAYICPMPDHVAIK